MKIGYKLLDRRTHKRFHFYLKKYFRQDIPLIKGEILLVYYAEKLLHRNYNILCTYNLLYLKGFVDNYLTKTLVLCKKKDLSNIKSKVSLFCFEKIGL